MSMFPLELSMSMFEYEFRYRIYETSGINRLGNEANAPGCYRFFFVFFHGVGCQSHDRNLSENRIFLYEPGRG